MKNSPPCYGEAGWLQWPDNTEYSHHFMRVLGTAQEGASTISECFHTATLIDPGDDESWYAAWSHVAEVNRARGDEAFAQRRLNAATSNWLRASNYFRTAEALLASKDPRRKQLLRNMKKCSRLYLEHKGEVIRIPYENGFLEAYFIEAPNGGRLLPVVICLGGADTYKDDLLYTMRQSAADNGLSVLLIDAPGAEALLQENRIASRADVEIPVTRWVDYLLSRGDVDPARIAIYGSGLGASHATRSASHDSRFAAAVCDGGLWDRHERLFVMNRREQARDGIPDAGRARQVAEHHLGMQLKCPYLMTIGQHDFLAVDDATDVFKSARRAGMRVDLKVFSAGETAASPGHIDNPTLANECIFEWIRERLTVKEAVSAARKSPKSAETLSVTG
jgi:dienelactone hydrolase